MKVKLMFLAFLCAFTAQSVSATELEAKLMGTKTIHVNGDEISLSITETKDGRICTQYIESIQFVAYGETAYTLGERCTLKTHKLERA